MHNSILYDWPLEVQTERHKKKKKSCNICITKNKAFCKPQQSTWLFLSIFLSPYQDFGFVLIKRQNVNSWYMPSHYWGRLQANEEQKDRIENNSVFGETFFCCIILHAVFILMQFLPYLNARSEKIKNPITESFVCAIIIISEQESWHHSCHQAAVNNSKIAMQHWTRRAK